MNEAWSMPRSPESYRNSPMTKICEAVEAHLPDDGKWMPPEAEHRVQELRKALGILKARRGSTKTNAQTS